MRIATAWLIAMAMVTSTAQQAAADQISETLSRTDIRLGMDQVRRAVRACDRHSHGQVTSIKMRITVAPTGFVMSARAINTRHRRLSTCVGAAIMQARFPATARGKTFTYPFRFGAHVLTRPPTTKPRPPHRGNCDEVGCMLDNYRGRCCKKYKRHRGPVQRIHSRPTRIDVRMGLRGIRTMLKNCVRHKRVRGKLVAKARFRIGADGRVGRVFVRRGHWKLRRCVRLALRAATFPKTRLGGSVNYPFVFRDPPPPAPTYKSCNRDRDCRTGNYCRTDQSGQAICMSPVVR